MAELKVCKKAAEKVLKWAVEKVYLMVDQKALR